MQLADWLKRTRIKRYEFARRIGVTPSVVTDYCQGKMWPGREKIEAIVRETAGEVGPADFISSEAQERLASVAQAEAAQ